MPQVRLEPWHDVGRREEVVVNRPVFRIGRADDCDYRVPNDAVSRQHCEIVVDNGRVRIRDLGSSNGTFVNRTCIGREHELKDGDWVLVSQFPFRICIDPDDTPSDQPTRVGIRSQA